MKTQRIEKKMGGMLIMLLLLSITPIGASNHSDGHFTVSGVVRDKLSKRALEYVNISIPGSNVGTVTNADGQFLLKIERTDQPKVVEISHVGYLNNQMALNDSSAAERTIWLTPYTNVLKEVTIHGQSPLSIVQTAIKKIPTNYSSKSNLLTGFYREIAQKGKFHAPYVV